MSYRQKWQEITVILFCATPSLTNKNKKWNEEFIATQLIIAEMQYIQFD